MTTLNASDRELATLHTEVTRLRRELASRDRQLVDVVKRLALDIGFVPPAGTTPADAFEECLRRVRGFRAGRAGITIDVDVAAHSSADELGAQLVAALALRTGRAA